MSSVVSLDVGRERRARTLSACPPIDVALLGCGNVGGAFAALTEEPSRGRVPVRVACTLVRDARRLRPTLRGDALRTESPEPIFASSPHVVVELLGGLEPARTLVLEALHRGLPVVTANKSLLAFCGRELREASAATRTPLLYEAAVIAGVPFLGTFARRPHAAHVNSIAGIANGTSNFVLTRAAERRTSIGEALAEAQRLGLAEPNPANDVDGIDAAEKLTVLLQHFAGLDVSTRDIETRGIRDLTAAEIQEAATLGGTIKPVIAAEWTDRLTAFAGPAFVASSHLLASVDDAENALVLGGPRGRIVFRGPGAGPDVTAATVLDDVLEAASRVPPLEEEWHSLPCSAGETEWFVSLAATRLPRGAEIADLLSSFGVFIRRTGPRQLHDGAERRAGLTWPCERARLEAALHALSSAAGCRSVHFRALGD